MHIVTILAHEFTNKDGTESALNLAVNRNLSERGFWFMECKQGVFLVQLQSLIKLELWKEYIQKFWMSPNYPAFIG